MQETRRLPYVGNVDTNEGFQIPLETAEVYEAKFVPAIFAEWAPHLLDALAPAPGSTLADVACGTGIVARAAHARGVSSIGIDLNEAMLTVARRVAPDLDWRCGDAAAIPLDDNAVDAASCQMAFMFFPDGAAVLAEMARVTRPGGRVGIVVPASLDRQPAYRPFVEIAVRHAGSEAASLLSTYWACGDLDQLASQAEAAGLEVVDRRTRSGTASFASAEDFVATEVEGSPLIERLDDATYAAIKADTAEALEHYGTVDGFDVPLVGHVLVAASA